VCVKEHRKSVHNTAKVYTTLQKYAQRNTAKVRMNSPRLLYGVAKTHNTAQLGYSNGASWIGFDAWDT
jgi:hypothetical protein